MIIGLGFIMPIVFVGSFKPVAVEIGLWDRAESYAASIIEVIFIQETIIIIYQ